MDDYVRKQIIAINKTIREYRKALVDATLNGIASASISSGGSSQSYTRVSLSDLQRMIADLETSRAKLLGGGRRRSYPDFC